MRTDKVWRTLAIIQLGFFFHHFIIKTWKL